MPTIEEQELRIAGQPHLENIAQIFKILPQKGLVIRSGLIRIGNPQFHTDQQVEHEGKPRFQGIGGSMIASEGQDMLQPLVLDGNQFAGRIIGETPALVFFRSAQNESVKRMFRFQDASSESLDRRLRQNIFDGR